MCDKSFRLFDYILGLYSSCWDKCKNDRGRREKKNIKVKGEKRERLPVMIQKMNCRSKT